LAEAKGQKEAEPTAASEEKGRDAPPMLIRP
jgi:hypothetical protein